jgi:hypothetical protein
MYVAQRSHVVQQMIRQAAGDMRLMNPVSLAENHASCRKNAKGDAVLPNGQVKYNKIIDASAYFLKQGWSGVMTI